MSVNSEIERLQNAKSALKTAIESKGVTVPNSTKLDGYADLVDSIEQGGSDGVYKCISLNNKGTTSNNPFVIQLDDIPTFIEVIEKAGTPEYFCFERTSNGKRTEVMEIYDERIQFQRSETQVKYDYISMFNSRASKSFT